MLALDRRHVAFESYDFRGSIYEQYPVFKFLGNGEIQDLRVEPLGGGQVIDKEHSESYIHNLRIVPAAARFWLEWRR